MWEGQKMVKHFPVLNLGVRQESKKMVAKTDSLVLGMNTNFNVSTTYIARHKHWSQFRWQSIRGYLPGQPSKSHNPNLKLKLL